VAFTATLDASVLYPLPLRDTLLRAAQVGMYDPYWSERILDEVARNLVGNGVASARQATAMLDAMRSAFDAATVAAEEIARLEPAMTNDTKDRHVLAAAASAQTDMLVTLNLRDFPLTACEPLSVEPVHPERFLLDLYRIDPEAMRTAIALQAAALTQPPMSVADVLDRLAVSVPRFTRALRMPPS
jgi:predicted nucleic acid-binding protein